jgi:2-oxoglutarate dehydrogenase E2 component (dihydrolipoamide succinyltransferase)
MARINIILPAMGEGVIEATINKWLVQEGASVSEDDPLVEVSTDKVDSEIPAPATGTVSSVIAKEGTVVKVGDVIAVIENEEARKTEDPEKVEKEVSRIRETIDIIKQEKDEVEEANHNLKSRTPSGKFVSPLVRSIASREGISYSELDTVTGTGMDGRITKDDITNLLESRKKSEETTKPKETTTTPKPEESKETEQAEQAKTGESEQIKEPVDEVKSVKEQPGVTVSQEDEVVEMDRVRRIIADHMVMSKRTSAHVTSFIDADVTRLMIWRNGFKDKFLEKEGIKLTLTPIFIDATARALNEFPQINVSVDGNNIIFKKNINIGMATALPNGNLIVPVIKKVNEKNLTGIARAVNDLADRARKNKLKPDEISGGTFTLTNFGSYDNLSGTPIINQPQVAILGTGAVRKKPAVLETPDGDVIAIRHIMILSLSYDHRVIDGALAGKFLHKVKEILENYTPDTP